MVKVPLPELPGPLNKEKRTERKEMKQNILSDELSTFSGFRAPPVKPPVLMSSLKFIFGIFLVPVRFIIGVILLLIICITARLVLI
ncbi:hypothetical protein KIPB_013150, partial [Kipferlia bialata]|eukprot:g13150.t1